MSRRLIVMAVLISILTIVQAFCMGMFVGRETKTCQLHAGNQRQLSPHERDNGPTPAGAEPRWNEERYSL